PIAAPRTVIPSITIARGATAKCEEVGRIAEIRNLLVISESVEHVTDFFTQAAQDARLGLADVVGGHVQLVSERRGLAALDHREPEGSPGSLFELAAHHLQGPGVEPPGLDRFVVSWSGERVGDLLETFPGIGSARRLGVALVAAKQ